MYIGAGQVHECRNPQFFLGQGQLRPSVFHYHCWPFLSPVYDCCGVGFHPLSCNSDPSRRCHIRCLCRLQPWRLSIAFPAIAIVTHRWVSTWWSPLLSVQYSYPSLSISSFTVGCLSRPKLIVTGIWILQYKWYATCAKVVCSIIVLFREFCYQIL